MKRFLRSPKVHMVILGCLLFAGVTWTSGMPTTGRQRVVIPKHRVDMALQVLSRELRRDPTREEQQAVLDEMIEEEVLFRYGLQIGIHESDVVQRRLAQIAGFVADGSDGDKVPEGSADEAIDMGLHEGDLLVRRIVADGARRLIRAVVLVRQPTDEALVTFYEANKEAFRVPQATRVTQVMVNPFRHGDKSEAKAREILDTIQAQGLTVDEAIGLAEGAIMPAKLPLQYEHDYSRRFGRRFVEALNEVPLRTWGGPLRSTYGYHLVYVHERREPHIPPLDVVREEVQIELLDLLAEEWVSLRVQQIRAGYDIVTPGFGT